MVTPMYVCYPFTVDLAWRLNKWQPSQTKPGYPHSKIHPKPIRPFQTPRQKKPLFPKHLPTPPIKPSHFPTPTNPSDNSNSSSVSDRTLSPVTPTPAPPVPSPPLPPPPQHTHPLKSLAHDYSGSRPRALNPQNLPRMFLAG